MTGVDLSGPYLAKAAKTCPAARFIEANGENIPLESNSADVVTSIYLFHELPQKARVAVISRNGSNPETGGRLILGDSLQFGDWPEIDRLLELFPHAFHEPYYKSWIALDLQALFAEAGLEVTGSDTGYLTKVAWADKPL